MLDYSPIPIRVLLVDDHQMMIDGLKALLENEQDVHIVGEANDGHSALELVESLFPDVVIADINMPQFSGIQLCLSLKEKHPHIRVLALSMHQDSAFVTEMLDAGAYGYILKNTGKQELVEAVKSVAGYERYLSPDVAQVLEQALLNSSLSSDSTTYPLTNRESEILKLVAQEYTNQQIAESLFISERTVETHRKNIFRKTNTKSIVGLIRYAITHQLV